MNLLLLKMIRAMIMSSGSRIMKLNFIYFVNLIIMIGLINPGISPYAKDLPKSITCTSTAYPPFVIEEDGKLMGIDLDIVLEAGKRLGVDVDFELMPWKRIESNLKAKNKKIQAVASFFKTEERDGYMFFTNVPTHITRYTLFVRKNEDIEFNHVNDLKGMIIGVNRGFKTTDEFEKAEENGIFKTEEVKTDDQNFLKLASGRIDAVLTNYHVGSYSLIKLRLDDKIKALQKPLSYTPAFLAFAKDPDLKQLVPEFDKALKQMQEDGTYYEIYQKYGVRLKTNDELIYNTE